MVSWTIDVDNAPLWWPWALGDQKFVSIDIDVDVDGETSDSYHCRTGVREVSMSNWILTVNGERMYTKGAYVRQHDIDLGRVNADELRHDIALAKDAGLDLLRIRRHVAHPAVYDAADDLGVLLYLATGHQWRYGITMFWIVFLIDISLALIRRGHLLVMSVLRFHDNGMCIPNLHLYTTHLVQSAMNLRLQPLWHPTLGVS